MSEKALEVNLSAKPLRGKERLKPMDFISYSLLVPERFFDFDAVASACRFYKRYRYDVYGGIQKNYPELWKQWLEYLENDGDRTYDKYNEKMFSVWLFDYCFGDVIDNE